MSDVDARGSILSAEELAETLAFMAERLSVSQSSSFVEQFDRNADLFTRDTGFIAPGRSEPLEAADTSDAHMERRQQAWDRWIQQLKADYVRHLAALLVHVEAQQRDLREATADAASCRSALITQQLDLENREAACCPEDVGFDEYIASLKKRLAQADAARLQLDSLIELKTMTVRGLHQRLEEIADAIGDDRPRDYDEARITVLLVRHLKERCDKAERDRAAQAERITHLETALKKLITASEVYRLLNDVSNGSMDEGVESEMQLLDARNAAQDALVASRSPAQEKP